jgi:hypothetical protein
VEGKGAKEAEKVRWDLNLHRCDRPRGPSNQASRPRGSCRASRGGRWVQSWVMRPCCLLRRAGGQRRKRVSGFWRGRELLVWMVGFLTPLEYSPSTDSPTMPSRTIPPSAYLEDRGVSERGAKR